MHDRVRKICCRLIFLLGVAVPTLLMLSWSVARNSSFLARQTRLRWQQQLEMKLGLDVKLAAIEYPRPGLVVLREVQLRDAETGVACGDIAAVRIWKTAGKQWVQLVEPRIYILESPESWRWVSERLLRQTELENIVVATAAIDFGHMSGKDSARFTGKEFACQLRSAADLTTLTINMQTSPSEDLPLALQLSRQHQQAVSTQVTLDTAATALPCRMLVPLFPQLAAMGEDARFQGQLSARKTVSSRVMDIAGEFSEVDLQHWLGPICSDGLTGSAQLQLNHAQIIDDYCVQAEGRLVADNGMIQRSLLQQSARELGLRWVHDLAAEQGVYERLSCRFDLDETGLQLRGEPEGLHAGVILRHSRGILLAEAKSSRRLSSQALARSLASPAAGGVPVSRGAMRLLQGPAGRQPVLQARPEQLPGSTLRR